MRGTREGPRVTVSYSCDGCVHERGECYVHQSDSGVDVYCDHPEVGGKRVGDTTWTTPTWCPYRRAKEIPFG